MSDEYRLLIYLVWIFLNFGGIVLIFVAQYRVNREALRRIRRLELSVYFLLEQMSVKKLL